VAGADVGRVYTHILPPINEMKKRHYMFRYYSVELHTAAIKCKGILQHVKAAINASDLEIDLTTLMLTQYVHEWVVSVRTKYLGAAVDVTHNLMHDLLHMHVSEHDSIFDIVNKPLALLHTHVLCSNLVMTLVCVLT
jgi:hypothetical protein